MLLILTKDLKVCHPRCVMSIIQNCCVCVSVHMRAHTVTNTTMLQLIAVYNTQLRM